MVDWLELKSAVVSLRKRPYLRQSLTVGSSVGHISFPVPKYLDIADDDSLRVLTWLADLAISEK